MGVVLRSDKGLPLTHGELDGNFTHLQNEVNGIDVFDIMGVSFDKHLFHVTNDLYHTRTESNQFLKLVSVPLGALADSRKFFFMISEFTLDTKVDFVRNYSQHRVTDYVAAYDYNGSHSFSNSSLLKELDLNSFSYYADDFTAFIDEASGLLHICLSLTWDLDTLDYDSKFLIEFPSVIGSVKNEDLVFVSSSSLIS